MQTNPTNKTTLIAIAGRFFFRFRNNLFPVMFLLVLVIARPGHIFPLAVLDRWVVACGAALVALGETVRLTTIGFDYIDRGGKAGRPAASRLVSGGIYAHSRNPMYFGNISIATGFALLTSSLLAYAVVIPLFLYVYLAITCAEEEFLRKEFGPEYEAYCARVPRFFPNLRGLGGTLSQGRYNWKKSFRQELSTLTWVSMALAASPLWRAYFLEGAQAARQRAPRTLWQEGVLLALYGILAYCKKRKWLFYPA